MTEVVFHVRVADPLAYGCRLLRKALARYPRITVTTAHQNGLRLDEALWTFSPRDFLPHALASAPESIRRASPILLVEADGAHLDADLPPAPLLVNFGGEPGAAAAAAFERVIEVVGDAPQEAAAARRRWRDYVAAGMAVSHRDLSDWAVNR